MIDIRCDDGTLPSDSLLANFGAEMEASLGKTGNTMKVAELMRPGIEAAGFTNIQHRWYKVPFGGWARHPIYKEAGECKMIEFKEGMQGWVTWALTKFGSPEPWSEEEVAVYVVSSICRLVDSRVCDANTSLGQVSRGARPEMARLPATAACVGTEAS